MERIDVVLVQRGLAESRLQAKRLILAGAVRVDNISQLKPGKRVPPDAVIAVEQPTKYVSRGGLKLEKALQTFNIAVQDKVALDVGASTGGFTDCLLQHGACFVYAVDVGCEQLARKLRQDSRVHVLEKTNIRYIDKTHFTHPLDIAVIDVSFISLRKVLPVVIEHLTPAGEGDKGRADVIALIKPQFEAGRVHVKKGGIVDDPRVHTETLVDLIDFVQENLHVTSMGLTFSPIHQDIRNIEYLLWLRKQDVVCSESGHPSSVIGALCPQDCRENFVREVVSTAHRAFSNN